MTDLGRPRRHRPAVRRILRDLGMLVSAPDAARDRFLAIPEPDTARYVAVARAHGVEGWLLGSGSPAAAWAGCAEQRRRFLAAHTRTRAELGRFGAFASRMGCDWVVIKGEALAEDVYPRTVLRYGVDIDVLVPPEAFGDLLASLVGDGWTLHDRNWSLIGRTLPGQLRVSSPSGGLFDLHWNLMGDPAERAAYPIRTADVLARRRSLTSGLPVLDPVDQLLHAALHAALSGANRLGWLVDAGLCARHTSDWATVADRVRDARADWALGLVLERANRWLGTPAPRGIGLRYGAPWRSVCAAVDRLSPLRANTERPALARAAARSARHGGRATAREFGRHAVGHLRDGVRGRRSPLGDVTDARSLLYPGDDPVARARFLTAARESESAGAVGVRAR